MPRSGLGANAWPSTATYTRSGLEGCTRIAAICPALGRPARVQVRPASVDLYIPSPGETLPRIGDSPVPTYTTLWSEGATAIAPIEPAVNAESDTANQLAPPSVVLNT